MTYLRAFLLGLVSAGAMGCATTVQRLDGELPTPSGPARGSCESSSWLTLAKTRAQVPTADGRSTAPRDDGVGVYRTGSSDPEDLTDLGEELGSTPTLDRHTAAVGRTRSDQWLGAGLGAGGLIALGIGTWLFASSFETETSRRSDGSLSEKQAINGGRAAAGGLLVGAGFGLGIAAIIVSPSSAERAKADQQRYVYLPPDDDPRELDALVGKHNASVRERCASSGR